MKKALRTLKYHSISRCLNLLVLVLTTVFYFSCEKYDSGAVTMEESYTIEEGACGTVILSERLGESFDEAVQLYEKEKSEFYLSFCPDENPCNDIRLEFVDLEVSDSDGKSPVVTFKGIMIIDKDTGELVESMSDAITSNGYHYTINWCPD